LGNICVDVTLNVNRPSARTIHNVPYSATALPTSKPHPYGPGVEFAVTGRYLIVPTSAEALGITAADYPVEVRCYVEETPGQHFGGLSGGTSGQCFYGKNLHRGNVKLTIGCRDECEYIPGDPFAQEVATGVEVTRYDLREAFFLVSWLQSDLIGESVVLSDELDDYPERASDTYHFRFDGQTIRDDSLPQ
jgi:hypothetical protein